MLSLHRIFLVFLLLPVYASAGTALKDKSLLRDSSLNFSLFSVEEDQIVELKKLKPQVTLVNFWRADCPPCVKELPLLLEASKTLGFRLITISVQSLSETQGFWPKVPGDAKQHLALLAPTNPNGILRRFGNKTGAIPHSVLLNTNNQACDIRTGELSKGWLIQRIASCKTSI